MGVHSCRTRQRSAAASALVVVLVQAITLVSAGTAAAASPPVPGDAQFTHQEGRFWISIRPLESDDSPQGQHRNILVHDTEQGDNVRNWHLRHELADEGVHKWTLGESIANENIAVESNRHSQLSVAIDEVVSQIITDIENSLQNIDTNLQDGVLQVPLRETPEEAPNLNLPPINLRDAMHTVGSEAEAFEAQHGYSQGTMDDPSFFGPYDNTLVTVALSKLEHSSYVTHVIWEGDWTATTLITVPAQCDSSGCGDATFVTTIGGPIYDTHGTKTVFVAPPAGLVSGTVFDYYLC